jgi:hypothetical protein
MDAARHRLQMPAVTKPQMTDAGPPLGSASDMLAASAVIQEVNGADTPVTNGDIMKIVRKFMKSNHTHHRADVEFVQALQPLFTLSTIFPAVVGAVRSRPGNRH